MRNNRLYLPLIVLALAACDKKTVQVEVESRVRPVDTEFIDGQPTVYAVCADTSFSWTPGDSISVLETDGTSYAFKTFVTAGSGKRAMFVGPVLEKGWSMTGPALYPADPNHSYDGSSFIYSLSGSYSEESGACPVGMLSAPLDENHTLGFAAVTGALAVNLSKLTPGDRYSVKIESSIPLRGSYKVSAEGSFTTAPAGGAANDQTVAVLAGEDGKAVAIFPLVPRMYNSIKVSVYVSSGKMSFSGNLANVLVQPGEFFASDVAVPEVLTPQQALGSLSDWASVPNVYSESNVHGGTPDMYNNVSGEPSPTLEVKFRSDEDFLYGYVKIDTTRFIYRYKVQEGDVQVDKKISGPASSMNNFTVWVDNDDVHADQSVYVGHWWHYTGYDLMMRGAAFSSCKPKDWNPSLRHASLDSDGKSRADEGNKLIYGGDAFGLAVTPAPTDIGYGNGTLTDGIIEWQFVVSRDALGIAEKTSAHVGLSFDEGWAGWSAYTLVPDINGFDVELSN